MLGVRGRETEGGFVDDVLLVIDSAIERAMHVVFHRAGAGYRA